MTNKTTRPNLTLKPTPRGFRIREDNQYSTIRPVAADERVSFALEVLEQRFVRESDALTSPEASRKFLRLKLSGLEHEVFAVLFLDNRHRVIAYEEMFRGTIDGASVHPREVVKAALRLNAAALILAHNHPSGVPEPSQADERLTRRLRDALGLVDIRVLDHIIVGVGEPVSFAERGLL